MKATQDKTRQGVETTKTGGLHPGKVPPESRFRPSSPRYGHFSVLTPGPPRAPRIGPETTRNGPKQGPERAQRVAAVPKVPPVRPKKATKRHGPGPRAPGRGTEPFMAVFGRFGAVSAPFGPGPGHPPPSCGGCPGGLAERFGPKFGFWTGHGWGNAGLEFRAGTGAGARVLGFLLL